ncbi:hypothetical protein HELRODRAFT_99525 [Helobdella robusta]|uniref:Arrestin C-terminal-like domain-containing protein n=1 Tax=Helobdella robusta TaxID=6412 RepID=T1G9T2_HELRO|nr:hypothetical protein HELRODRAFT_99525 [Helobdella robusta]ESO04633.1 hypothetical protein HELRODRAFT_99525 [Helobdella robusta]
MSFLFSSNVEVSIQLDGQESRKKAEMKVDENRKDSYLIYYDGESVTGKVNVVFKKNGSKLDHHGIKIEFIGQIELFNDKSNRQEFSSLVRELANPGELTQNTSYPFEFLQVEKPYESYQGTNVKLCYFLRVTVVKRLSDIVRELPICVHTLSHYPDTNCSIKMEVGIEDCLHIEFEYSKSKYHLTDVIVGKIYFILVRLKIKHMEIQIIKKEAVGSETNPLVDNEILTKFEIMDGLPVRGESVPIRLFLSGYDLTPTMKDINKKFSVRYFINLVLIDEEDRRYFKQQEITLFRKSDKLRKVLQQQQQQQPEMQSQQASSLSSLLTTSSTSSQQQQQNLPSNSSLTDKTSYKSKVSLPISDSNISSDKNNNNKNGNDDNDVRDVSGLDNDVIPEDDDDDDINLFGGGSSSSSTGGAKKSNNVNKEVVG